MSCWMTYSYAACALWPCGTEKHITQPINIYQKYLRANPRTFSISCSRALPVSCPSNSTYCRCSHIDMDPLFPRTEPSPSSVLFHFDVSVASWCYSVLVLSGFTDRFSHHLCCSHVKEPPPEPQGLCHYVWMKDKWICLMLNIRRAAEEMAPLLPTSNSKEAFVSGNR